MFDCKLVLRGCAYNHGSTGPIGPTGATGATGATGKPGPPGKCFSNCTAAFEAVPCQKWQEGRALRWERSCRRDCCPICLSNDGTSIILESGHCCIVSFTMSIFGPPEQCGNVCAVLRAPVCGKSSDKFVFCAHPACRETPVNLTAAGILISPNGRRSTELSLVLRSPDCVKVRQGSISIMEI